MSRCPAPALGQLFQTLLDLWEHEDADIDVSLVLSALGQHSVRDRVKAMEEHARMADDPTRLFQGAVEFLEQHEQADEIRRLQAQIKELEAAGAHTTPRDAEALERALQRLIELQRPSPS